MPSASDFEINIGRGVETNDIFTAKLRFPSSDLKNGSHYAVTSSPDGNGDFGVVEFVPGVGPTTKTVVVNIHRNVWSNMVKHEDRTDIR